MWDIVLTTLALVLVMEGILPFLSPRLWRQSLLRMVSHPDKMIRIYGLVSMLVGAGMMVLIHAGILF